MDCKYFVKINHKPYEASRPLWRLGEYYDWLDKQKIKFRPPIWTLTSDGMIEKYFLKKHMNKNYELELTWRFANKNDAMKFKLRFG